MLVPSSTTSRWTSGTPSRLLTSHSYHHATTTKKEEEEGGESRYIKSNAPPIDQTPVTTMTTTSRTQVEETSRGVSSTRQQQRSAPMWPPLLLLLDGSAFSNWDISFSWWTLLFVPGEIVLREKSSIALGKPCCSLMIWTTMSVVEMTTSFLN